MTLLAGRRPKNLGPVEGRLSDCPNSPNCVCSDGSREDQQVEALRVAKSLESSWNVVRDVVESLPRTKVVTDTGRYLHAECSSALLGFVDDLELLWQPEAQRLAVRSASRVGYSDLGVNRARVEGLRRELIRRGVVVA